MNALKLVMDERHLDQWVCIEGVVLVDELLEVSHQRNDGRGVLRRRVDGAAIAGFQRGAGQPSKACAVALELRLDFQNVIVSQKAGFPHVRKTDAQGQTVVRYLFRSGTGGIFGKGSVAKQLVMGGDDVLNGRAVFGFLKPKGVDQDALVWNRRRDALELRQPATGRGQLLQDVRPVETHRGYGPEGGYFSHLHIDKG